MTDTLVDAARSGDRDSLERLLAENIDRIHALCRRMTGNDADGADATQEALIKIVTNLGRFDGRSTFSTWAYRIATNACLDEIRRRQRRPIPFDQDSFPVGTNTTDVASTVAAAVDVDAALDRIPPDFRVAVVLRDLCGLDYAEISEVLDIPPGTVRSRIARGRAALADTLGGNPSATRNRPTPES